MPSYRKKKGDKTFTRPEGWEKKIKRSHFDSSKNFAGESDEDVAKKYDEDSTDKEKKGFFKSLRDKFSCGGIKKKKKK